MLAVGEGIDVESWGMARSIECLERVREVKTKTMVSEV